jgi:hypothetical protein
MKLVLLLLSVALTIGFVKCLQIDKKKADVNAEGSGFHIGLVQSQFFSSCLSPKLSMHGAIPPHPHSSSWRRGLLMAWYLVKHRDNSTFIFIFSHL